MRKKLCLIFIILLASIVVQASEKEDVWKPMKKIVFRQFHVEGFIIQYILDDISYDGNIIVILGERTDIKSDNNLFIVNLSMNEFFRGKS